MPNFSLSFVVETDASGYGVGAALIQSDRPVAFFSKLLGVRAQLKSIYEKELMAICLAVLKWKHYLQGWHFTVHTDQQSLRFIMQQREIGADYQQWVSKLMAFDFNIVYKRGASNHVVDALSRKLNGDVMLGTLISTSNIQWDLLDKEVEVDPFLSNIKRDINLNSQ